MEFICNQSIKTLKWNDDVTLKTIKSFEEGLLKLINNPESSLILDLIDVEYMNSAGLGILVDTVLKARKNQKEMVVVGVNDTLMEIFNIVKISTIIKLFKNEEDAIAYFEERNNE